jgi:hypothetical protein
LWTAALGANRDGHRHTGWLSGWAVRANKSVQFTREIVGKLAQPGSHIVHDGPLLLGHKRSFLVPPLGDARRAGLLVKGDTKQNALSSQGVGL